MTMTKFQFTPSDKSLALPGRSLESQLETFLEDASETAVWDKVKNRPGAATAEKSGLMTAADKQDLEAVKATATRFDTASIVNNAGAPQWLPAASGYHRSVEGWQASPTCLFPPAYMAVFLAGKRFYCQNHPPLSLNNSANWAPPDCSVNATRFGRDIYFHAVVNAVGTCTIALSAYPDAISEVEASLLLGGCHCLCVKAGTISGHILSGLNAGEILPLSVWDMWRRPASVPGGMVYDPRLLKWVDIYLADSAGIGKFSGVVDKNSDANTRLASLAKQSKHLLSSEEIAAALTGSSSEAHVLPGTAGGHSDSAGRRVISHIGIEDQGEYRGASPPFWR